MKLTYCDLYTDEGLTSLHQAFLQTQPSENLLERAVALQTFLENAFGSNCHDDISDQIFAQNFRRQFVQRYALMQFGDGAPAPHPQNIPSWAHDVWKRFQNGENVENEARYAAWAARQPNPHPWLSHPLPREWEPYLLQASGTRADFSLADPGLSRDAAYKEAFYCIGCHKQSKDSCSKGMPGENPLGVQRTGCPLGQKISEMAVLTQQGQWLAALALAMINNPLIAGTGHRICTACMDACIYQKQDPVRIPGLESHLLQNLYKVPYGFEIYRLLTLWNPLSPQPLPLNPTGRHALVAGLGPAGMMISHGLLRQGHSVRAVDGLHIRTLPDALRTQELLRRLPDKKDPAWEKDGFGGVMTYGITARWDASHLLVLRLLLERHPRFELKGNIRLGSTTTIARLREVGFDHIALCLGAGAPSKPNPPLLKGSRFAHDFLMGLHLQRKPPKVELPCIVVGGGLTAVDAATEVLVWLRQQLGTDLPPNAVTLLYRRPLGQSPAWRLNADEVRAAAEEGVHIIDNMTPLATVCDNEGRVTGLHVKKADGEEIALPAKTVLLATGTDHHTLEEHDLPNPKNLNKHEFLIEKDISVLGDVHPYYRGSVVEAMASAKNALPIIHESIMTSSTTLSDIRTFWNNLGYTWHQPEAIGHKLWHIKIKAPEAARAFQPGQFFRISVRYHAPIPLTGAWVDGDDISMLMQETPFTQPLIDALNAGEYPGFMGPTGAPTHIPHNNKVQLVGSGFGHGALLPIAQRMKQQGCTITYIGEDDGTYTKWRPRIEEWVDACHWFTDMPPGLNPTDYTLIIGPPAFLKKLRQQTLPDESFACLTSSMQCMMKGLCGRCLTPVGQDTYVWACAEQDQPLKN